MKDAYAVLRQKEIEQSSLEREVEVLRFVAPLLDDGRATLLRAVNHSPQPNHSGWQHRDKKQSP
jgi:hypothetical protein